MTPNLARVLIPALLGLAACGGESTAEAAPTVERSDSASQPEVAPEPGPPPTRIRLFDHIDPMFDQAGVRGEPAPPPTATAFDFGEATPEEIFFARVDEDGDLDWDDDVGTVDAEGGTTGGALRLGPDLPEDRSRAVFLVEVPGLARVRVHGRVKIEGNPKIDDATSREVLRVTEHSRTVTHPRRVPRWMRGRAQRVSRQLDPSGWDRFEVAWITRSNTTSVEIALLHRSGGSAAAVTRFDDVTIECVRLSEKEAYDHLAESYRPNDGNEDTPWRLRAELASADGKRQEVRDAVLLPPPSSLLFPLQLPAAETNPRLRFHYGMLREAHGADGDGARIVARFRGDDGSETPIGSCELDPKNRKEHRRWQVATFDLTTVGGTDGTLELAVEDVAGEGPDPMDAVVIATPRIEPAEEAPEPFNVLLIGVDTLRADKLSAFGYDKPTTPHLEKLADAGVRFPQTRSQAPWTLPSFSSILTSLYPSTHGAGRGGHDEWTPIDPTTTSLAEVLARVGYETQGIVSNGLISPHYGLDQGFEGYQSEWAMESVGRDTEAVTSFIAGHRTTPWLLFWHIMDPHLPYETEDGYRESFTEAGYDGRFRSGGWGGGPAVPFQVLDPRPGRRWFAHEGPPPPPDLDEQDRRYVHDYYDAEIAETDASIGEVLDALRASGQWERTIVALVADHGEGLGEHNHYHHGYTLFDDQVHIPMILRIPGAHEGRTVERPVASIDLAPTILGALGLDVPEFMRGVDRLAEDAPTDDAYFCEYPTYDSSAQKAWVLGNFKYLHDPLFHSEALYDLAADPGEQNNVLAEHPEIAQRARREMDAFRWEELQKGRFHLRVQAAKGQRLTVKVTTNDLFDANFASRPIQPERDFTMDLARKNWSLDTTLLDDEIELVFWCRGNALRFEVKLDGKPCGIDVGAGGTAEASPLSLEREVIPTLAGASLGWPKKGTASLWLEGGVANVLPVVLSPEEIERLKELGYTR